MNEEQKMVLGFLMESDNIIMSIMNNRSLLEDLPDAEMREVLYAYLNATENRKPSIMDVINAELNGNYQAAIELGNQQIEEFERRKRNEL
ncbi:hypothetical protein I6N96_03275 [Enterococcus sp. BWM-S5]|uniref:Uncharacterized protein n=1 Tax=Enterococcus larvae TaxID=2794352 RepID=A0ABS4CF77_9ENTE|nr:hypothetical protein [Enterococcus larvae]MBP1045285.1 hypothetical protein [Enterococcus larvae]